MNLVRTGQMQYNKRNEVLQLLSQAWLVYAQYFDGRNYERVLQAICEAQLAVFEEEESCPGPEDFLRFGPG